jgi:glycine/D-amino acid oxidase-like deaminating enzyme
MGSNSLWYQTGKENFPRLDDKMKTDVLIVGGGITGLSAAYYLTKAGVKTVVLEASEIGRGVTGHTTAHVTSQHGVIYQYYLKRFGKDKTRQIVEANESAISEMEKIAAEEKIDCDFMRVDSAMYTNDPLQVRKIETENATAVSLGIDAEFMRDGNFALPYKAATVYKNQAQFQPLKYLYGLASALKKKGCCIFEQSRVLHIEGNKAVTQEGIVTAENIVIATHFPIINFPGWYFARAYQDRSYVMAFQNAPAVSGLWNSIDGDALTYRMYENLLIISGINHRCGTQKKTDHYGKLKNQVIADFPKAMPVFQWSAQDPITLDELPYIGKYSRDSKRLYVATGYRKWGMTQSNVAGRILADEIMGVKNPYAKIYSPQRPATPLAVFNCFVWNTVTTADLLSGFLRFGPPLCAHMKCRLRWNPDENSWDCPCHGSRFEENGSVINQPAIHDLKRRAE